jgi:hypothetical protein
MECSLTSKRTSNLHFNASARINGGPIYKISQSWVKNNRHPGDVQYASPFFFTSFACSFIGCRFELSSLIYEETVPIRPEDHVELLLH